MRRGERRRKAKKSTKDKTTLLLYHYRVVSRLPHYEEEGMSGVNTPMCTTVIKTTLHLNKYLASSKNM
jgi:hypothetical protein